MVTFASGSAAGAVTQAVMSSPLTGVVVSACVSLLVAGAQYLIARLNRARAALEAAPAPKGGK